MTSWRTRHKLEFVKLCVDGGGPDNYPRVICKTIARKTTVPIAACQNPWYKSNFMLLARTAARSEELFRSSLAAFHIWCRAKPNIVAPSNNIATAVAFTAGAAGAVTIRYTAATPHKAPTCRRSISWNEIATFVGWGGGYLALA